MRLALELSPVDCCKEATTLLKQADQRFVLERNGVFLGSVFINGHEIDDLIVAKKFQRQGYGGELLRFAVTRMQSQGLTPIFLRVADWNQGAIRLYHSHGFQIIQSQLVRGE